MSDEKEQPPPLTTDIGWSYATKKYLRMILPNPKPGPPEKINDKYDFEMHILELVGLTGRVVSKLILTIENRKDPVVEFTETLDVFGQPSVDRKFTFKEDVDDEAS